MTSRRSVLRRLSLGALAAGGAGAFVAWRGERTGTPPTGPVIEIGGRRVHAHVAGEGPPVILLHGASGTARDFTFGLVDRLAPHYRVIAFDRPGHGHSDPLHPRGESPAEQVAQLDAAAEALGIGPAVVVGQSYGGAVALSWALERPARVAAVVTLAGVALPWPGTLAPWYGIAASRLGGATVVPLVSAFAPEARVAETIAGIFAPDPVPPGYADHIGLDLIMRRRSLLANARQVHTLRPHVVAQAARYDEITVPVEAVHGTADTIVPAETHAIPLPGRIAGARLTLLPGTGHMPQHADPGAAVAAIDRAAARAGLR